MAHLDPNTQFDKLKANLLPSIQGLFPVTKGQHILKLNKVWIEDKKDFMDLSGQKEARLGGRSWTVPVYGDLSLVDGQTGKTIDRVSKFRLISLPKTTHRFSYIVNGKEYQTLTQFLRRPGVYSRVAQNGVLVSQFNLSRKGGADNFNINFDPTTRMFTMQYRNSGSNIRLYPVLQGLGMTDKQLEGAWGKEILEANRVKNPAPDYRKLFRIYARRPYTNADETLTLMRHVMENTELDPETTKITLGKAYKKVEGGTILGASQKLLGLSRNETAPDDMHSLVFKRTHAIEDFLPERLQKEARKIKRRIHLNLDRKRTVSGVMSLDYLNRPVKTFFTSSSLGLAFNPEQVNPLEMVTGQTRTTILGTGGISNEHQITAEEKSINPSHLGFLDPVVTPESSRIGAVLSLPLGVRKVGTELRTMAYDMKTGRDVQVKPMDIFDNVAVFPDQVTWKGGKPKAIGARIKTVHKGDISERPLSQARFVFKNPKALFSVATNLIPYIQNNMGNRAVTGARQQEQAISLVKREAPLVQAGLTSSTSFEESVGKYFAAHSPVQGKVMRVGQDFIVIKGRDQKLHRVPMYHHFPMNDGKSYFHSEPLVTKGDSVKKGQLVADSNFTRKGTLALGTNIDTAYLPFKGYNFEDGIVISESAATKLTSNHLHRVDLQLDENTLLGRARFIAYRRKDLPTVQADKLDKEGVIKPGQIVKPGDMVIAALQRRDTAREAALLTRISRGRISPYKNASITWTEDYEGKVIDVVKGQKGVAVYIQTKEPAQVGDKIVGRHGNKGVITSVLPDHEMPYRLDAKGNERPVGILMNPAGIPGRVNLGQLLETASAKVAEKSGKRLLVQNFSHTNQVQAVQASLKAAKLTDKEVLYDAESKRPLGPVLVGPQYILKLKHQVGSKLTARGKGDNYDINNMPNRGGSRGGQALGPLGVYALLAHGAKANLRDMATYASDHNPDYWHAIQTGEPLPPPRTPFTYDKFTAYLRGAGINIHKQGNDLMLMPLTDARLKALSAGALPNPSMVIRGKDLSPIKGGLFDYNLTGGPEGRKWSHIRLAEPIPNPVFEGAIKSLLGITDRQLRGLIEGTSGVTKEGQLDPEGPIRGGKAVELMLNKIDVTKRLAALKKTILDAPASRVNALNKQIKILQGLKQQKLQPSVYIMHNAPILPPIFRPLTPRPDGSLNQGDLNGLYKNLAEVNEQFQMMPKSLPEAEKAPLRAALYDGLKATMLVGKDIGGKQHQGIISIIAGASFGPGPKTGFFQSRMIKRRQDLTMRSTIVPEPKLGLDEVGVPEDGAWELYKPFVQRRLSHSGLSPLRAEDEIKRKTPQARAALEHVMDSRPVLMKRDPVLHKFGVMAFKPVLHKGKAVQMHPLVTEGYAADFDGDTVSLFVPVTSEAVQEAHDMFPSNNLFSSTTGKLMNKLSHESLLGTYMLSEWGKGTTSRFATREQALRAASSGKIRPTDVIRVGKLRTTVGRMILANALPRGFQLAGKDVQTQLMTRPNFILDKQNLTSMLTGLARHDKYKFADSVSRLNRIGTGYAYSSGFSIGLDDLAPVSGIRDRVLRLAEQKAERIRKGTGTLAVKQQRVIDNYDKANQLIESLAKKHFDKSGNNIYKMVRSGARGNWDQFKQMTVAPGLVRNSNGTIVPVPIKKSYSEGLDTADYWNALQGGREGIVQKVVGTSKPGAFSKDVMANVLNLLISDKDCGTPDGVFRPAADPQIMGRFLAQPVKIRGQLIRRGTLVDSTLVTRLENNKIGKVLVRSPLRCKQPQGICARCYGLNEFGKLHAIGTNIGALAGHSIGEPATQLALKSFHEGGVAGTKTTKRSDAFARINQILQMPTIMPNASVLAQSSGKITQIQPDPAGGWSVHVEETKHYVPAARQLLKGLRKGVAVKKGQSLSDGDIHPVELLKLTSINAVQEHLTNELFNAYKPVGPVKRSNIETVVKAITNLSQVHDSGDHPSFTRGDMASTSLLKHVNRTDLRGQKPISFKPVLRPLTQLPQDISTDWLARMNYQRLKDTLVDGAQRGWVSRIHQHHPIPALAMGSEFGRGTKNAPWLY